MSTNCKVIVNDIETIKSLYDYLLENGYKPIGSKNDFKYPVIIVENGIFFKSITDLAYGRYAYIVKQLDERNNLLIETDFIEFYIRKQQPPMVNSGNICVI